MASSAFDPSVAARILTLLDEEMNKPGGEFIAACNAAIANAQDQDIAALVARICQPLPTSNTIDISAAAAAVDLDGPLSVLAKSLPADLPFDDGLTAPLLDILGTFPIPACLPSTPSDISPFFDDDSPHPATWALPASNAIVPSYTAAVATIARVAPPTIARESQVKAMRQVEIEAAAARKAAADAAAAAAAAATAPRPASLAAAQALPAHVLASADPRLARLAKEGKLDELARRAGPAVTAALIPAAAPSVAADVPMVAPPPAPGRGRGRGRGRGDTSQLAAALPPPPVQPSKLAAAPVATADPSAPPTSARTAADAYYAAIADADDELTKGGLGDLVTSLRCVAGLEVCEVLREFVVGNSTVAGTVHIS